MEVITSWETLIAKAKAVGKARVSGDTKALQKAEEDLKAYEEIVKMSNKMILPIRRGVAYAYSMVKMANRYDGLVL